MADFCKQCSERIFGEDLKELADLITRKDDEAGFVARVICEGCGHTEVNSNGKCVYQDCLEGGHGEIRSGAV